MHSPYTIELEYLRITRDLLFAKHNIDIMEICNGICANIKWLVLN
jgi:hypothetical protein